MRRDRLPDFIIGGAPKCATTSVHTILAHHPDIGIPATELHFFDSDDPVTHPDFFFVEKGRLISYPWDAERSPLYPGYVRSFAPYAGLPLVGEDSTTYLFSEVAAHRIKNMLPDVKMIFMLRNPVERAYSQYWHLVQTSRAILPFERAIKAHPSIILGSTYAGHLERYLKLFGPEQIGIFLFEEFVRDKQTVVHKITQFIGAARMEVPATGSWTNRSSYPSSVRVQLLANRVGRHLQARRYANHLGSQTDSSSRAWNAAGHRWTQMISKLLTPVSRAPEMRHETRALLSRHLSDRNRGLSNLLGRDLSNVWPGFTG